MKSPKPPSPYATGAAQQQAETGAAIGQSIIGNPNVYTPYGSQTYSIAGWEQVPDAQGRMISVPRYNQVQQLSPDQMRLLGLQTQGQYNLGQTAVEQSARLRNLLGQSVSTAGWTPWQQGPQAAQLATTFADVGGPQRAIADQNVRQDTGPTDRAAVEQAMLGRWSSDAARQNAAQEAQLAARGLNVGSSQYGSVREQQDRARTDALQQAYLASGQEARAAQEAYNQAAAQRFQQGATQGQFANLAQQQAYQQAMQRAGFSNEAIAQMFNMGGTAADRANALRQQQAQEAFALRNQPLNEISALMAGGQVTLPSFNPYQSQGINSANIAGQIANNYAQQSQQAGAFNSGLFGLGAAGVGSMFGPGGMFGGAAVAPSLAGRFATGGMWR